MFIIKYNTKKLEYCKLTIKRNIESSDEEVMCKLVIISKGLIYKKKESAYTMTYQ